MSTPEERNRRRAVAQLLVRWGASVADLPTTAVTAFLAAPAAPPVQREAAGFLAQLVRDAAWARHVHMLRLRLRLRQAWEASDEAASLAGEVAALCARLDAEAQAAGPERALWEPAPVPVGAAIAPGADHRASVDSAPQ
jgi:hypothetical protein